MYIKVLQNQGLILLFSVATNLMMSTRFEIGLGLMVLELTTMLILVVRFSNSSKWTDKYYDSKYIDTSYMNQSVVMFQLLNTYKFRHLICTISNNIYIEFLNVNNDSTCLVEIESKYLGNQNMFRSEGGLEEIIMNCSIEVY